MANSESDTVFAGSIPELYDKYLVPLIFEHYASDLAMRLAPRPLSSVLEIAAGTGVVTRALDSALPGNVQIIATDLNPAMIDYAAGKGTSGRVQWRQADAMKLPFGDAVFDAVACQFGMMFMPDKPAAFAEILRVLKSGGVLFFNVWDRIETNEFADVVTDAVALMFPDDPPRFLARTPHGYHDTSVIRQDLAKGGFEDSTQIETLQARSRASSPRVPAIAYCEGTPLKNEIESRDAARLTEATNAASEAIAAKFGRGAVDGAMQAHVITVISNNDG